MPRKKGSKNQIIESKIVKAFLVEVFALLEKKIKKLPVKLFREFKKTTKNK